MPKPFYYYDQYCWPTLCIIVVFSISWTYCRYFVFFLGKARVRIGDLESERVRLQSDRQKLMEQVTVMATKLQKCKGEDVARKAESARLVKVSYLFVAVQWIFLPDVWLGLWSNILLCSRRHTNSQAGDQGSLSLLTQNLAPASCKYTTSSKRPGVAFNLM